MGPTVRLGTACVKGQGCVTPNFLLIRTGRKFTGTAKPLPNPLPADGEACKDTAGQSRL